MNMSLSHALLAYLLVVVPSDSDPISVELTGPIESSDNISAVILIGDKLVIASDETNGIQVAKPIANGKYKVGSLLPLINSDDEIDLEGLASDGEHIYAIGSHSLVRKKLKPNEDSQKKSRKRLIELDKEQARDSIFRFRLNQDGSLAGEPESISLRTILNGDELLRAFAGSPSKENGVDIEGIAFFDGKLYVGFRGPVLREGYVPILVTSFENPAEYQVIFVNLHGLGIRDITRAADRFLILAGPVNDFAGDFKIFQWDGKDGIPGKDVQVSEAKVLATIDHPEKGKAEGLAVLRETDDEYRLLVLFDGIERGAPKVFNIGK
jgi:hypothetical protein